MAKKFKLELAVEMLLTVPTLDDIERKRLILIQMRNEFEPHRDLIVELYDKHFMYGVEE